MRKMMALLLAILLLLCGCSGRNEEFDKAMLLRTQLLNANGCRFQAVVTADYGDQIYTFSLNCEVDKAGNVSFTVNEPEYISGIKGQISNNGGKLTFDDVALSFALQVDDMLSPVSAPWIFVRSLREGYVRSCGSEGDSVRITVDDSYQEDALMLDIWLDGSDCPFQADIYEDNRRILTLQITDFVLL